MNINVFNNQMTNIKYSRWWPTLGTPQEIAKIMNGSWSSMPKQSIEAFRHRLDTIDDGLQNFLFVPELFAKPNGTAARKNMFASSEALSKGAIGIVASRRPRNIGQDIPLLQVEDVSQSISRIAAIRRQKSQAKFIAVTGSVGKTTTKNMIHALASKVGPSHRSIANYNDGMESINFSLSNLSLDHNFSAVEFSEVGGLADQTELYRPHISVITNIQWEHIDRMERQGYVGESAIRRLAFLAAGAARNSEPGGICILNADQPNFAIIFEEIRKSLHVKIVTVGKSPNNDIRINSIQATAEGSSISIGIEGRTHRYWLGIPGVHMALNSVAAAAAAFFAGIDLESALEVFKSFEPDARRGIVTQVMWKCGIINIRDETVSSSVPSILSSLAMLEKVQLVSGGRRVAVLGQINGLGHTMPSAMSQLAKQAEATSINRFYTIGSDIRLFNEAIKDRSRVAPHFQTLDQLEKALREELQPGDEVVLKGTRNPANISLRCLVERLMQTESEASRLIAQAPNAHIKRIVVGGDTYFGEYYQDKRAKRAELNYLDTFGYDYSGKHLAPLLQRADITIINLECALTKSQSSKLEGRKDYILRGEPAQTIEALRNLNVRGVLLGNNHSMDYSASGLQETIDCLKQAGMEVSGAGNNRKEAQEPILKEIDVDGTPFKIALLSGYEYNDSHESMGFYAGAEKIGVNNINLDRMKLQIAELKSKNYFTIVSPHWGTNYCFKTYSQSHLARRFVELGADLVLGHGPHMMNEIVRIDGVWVAYSLGNLIFNSEGEYDRQNTQCYSLVAEIELRRQASTVVGHLNLYPIVSCNQLTQFQPTFADDHQFEQVREMLKTMQYDNGGSFANDSFRKIDGRNCMTLPLFG